MSYPTVLGIPDFRLAPDPWIGMEEDRDRGARLEGATIGAGFEATVRAYWAMTPETPQEVADRFVGHVLDAAERSRDWLAALPPAAPGAWLDLGCGTADLAAAAPAGTTVMSIDVAFRWLVVARRRLTAAGRPSLLACCQAEALPFPDRSFAQVLSLGMLEHATSPDAVFREARRVLVSGGALHVRTVNRYSLLAEPHVKVWGVGLVPRRWADAYVRSVSGRRYLHHRPCSPREIRGALGRAGFSRIRVRPARLLSSERERLTSFMRWVGPMYEAAGTRPVVATLATWIAPLLDVSATAD